MRFKNNEIRFSKLRVSLFAQNQSATSDNSSFTILKRESNESREWKAFVSSAKKDKEQGGGYIRQIINVNKKQTAEDQGLNHVEPQT